MATAPLMPSPLEHFLTAWRPIVPIPGLLLILPLVYLFFRSTWRQLDEEAYRYRGELLAKGEQDLRPLVAMVLCAVILTMHDYFGGRSYFEEAIHPMLTTWDDRHIAAHS